MNAIVSANPFRCRMWTHHDRIESYLTAESCKVEIASFLRHGQFVPALGRPLHDEPEFDVELIYGARRLFVARHLNKPLLVELRELSDRDAIIAMDVENRQREDISSYERGISYAEWLREGFFASQDEIARALKVSASQISRLIKLAQLPAVVVDAFERPADICEGWGIELVAFLDDPMARKLIVQRARLLAAQTPRSSGREVYKQLRAAAAGGHRRRWGLHDEVVRDVRGASLFRIRHHTKSIAIILPIETVSDESLERIKHVLTGALHHPAAVGTLSSEPTGQIRIS